MKIITVCSSWRVFGAETITLKLLEGFKRRGHDQIAITSLWSDGEMSRRLRQLRIREEVMPFGAVVASISPKHLKWTADVLLRLPSMWWRWRRLMRQFQPDVIIWTGSKQAMLLWPWLGKHPSFLMEFTNTAPTRNIRRLYERLAKKLAGFVAVSDFMRSHLHALGAPLEKITVVKSGAFFEAEYLVTKRHSVRAVRNRKDTARIGIIGQVAPNKGHDCLVEAVRLLKNQDVRLCIRTFGGGDAKYISQLKDKIQQAGLSDIWEWMGYERDKAKIFDAIDICVVPSCFGDPFPTVAMEAGVYGLPIVASRIGGLPEIIEEDVTGYLVEPNSPEQLAGKIQYLINHSETASEMGRAGRERIFKLFTVEKMVMEFESLFKEFVLPADE